MRVLVIIFSSLLLSISLYGQSKKESTSTFEVKGNCELCKERIEAAALYAKGVKFAEWDVSSKIIKVIYNNRKTNEDKIQQSIAQVGHATEKAAADSAAYQALPMCCQYKGGSQHDHTY